MIFQRQQQQQEQQPGQQQQQSGSAQSSDATEESQIEVDEEVPIADKSDSVTKSNLEVCSCCFPNIFRFWLFIKTVILLY